MAKKRSTQKPIRPPTTPANPRQSSDEDDDEVLVHDDDKPQTEEEQEDARIGKMADDEDRDEFTCDSDGSNVSVMSIRQAHTYLKNGMDDGAWSDLQKQADSLRKSFHLLIKSNRISRKAKRNIVGQVRRFGGPNLVFEVYALYLCGETGIAGVKKIANFVASLVTIGKTISNMSVADIEKELSEFVVRTNDDPKGGTYLYFYDRVEMMTRIVEKANLNGRSERNQATIATMLRLVEDILSMVYVGKTVKHHSERKRVGYDGNYCMSEAMRLHLPVLNLFFEANEKIWDPVVSSSLRSVVCLIGEALTHFLFCGRAILGELGSMNKIPCGVGFLEPFLVSLHYLLEEDEKFARWDDNDGAVFILDFPELDSNSMKYGFGKSHCLKRNLLHNRAWAVLPDSYIKMALENGESATGEFYTYREKVGAFNQNGSVTVNPVPFAIEGFKKGMSPLALPKPLPKDQRKGDNNNDSDRGSWFAPLVGHSGSSVKKVALEIVDYFIENNPPSELPGSGEYDSMEKWASRLCCVCALNPVQLKNKLIMAYEANPKSKSVEETADDMLDSDEVDLNQMAGRFASMANGKNRSRSGRHRARKSQGLSKSTKQV